MIVTSLYDHPASAFGLQQVSIDFQSAMKDTENIDIAVWLNQVCYTVMFVKKNTNFAGMLRLISLSKPRMSC